MNPSMAVVVIMNNYFHDVATALLLASSLVVWVLARHLGNDPTESVREYFLRIYHATTKIAKFALWWVLLAGVPRVFFFKEMEWNEAVGKGMIVAIVVKHCLIAIIVVAGIHLWLRLSRRVRKLRSSA